jgi:hypothetical protein
VHDRYALAGAAHPHYSAAAADLIPQETRYIFD